MVKMVALLVVFDLDPVGAAEREDTGAGGSQDLVGGQPGIARAAGENTVLTRQ